MKSTAAWEWGYREEEPVEAVREFERLAVPSNARFPERPLSRWRDPEVGRL